MLRGLSWRNFDFLLLGAVVLASAFGITMIRSAIAGNEELLLLPTRQLYFVIVGVVVIFALASIDYRYWLSLHWPIYFATMAFLVALSNLGQAAFGAQRWFQVGVLNLQPTEFAKITVILMLARFFEKSQNDPRDWRWLAKSLAWVWGLLIWILLQPNLSNVVVTMVIWAMMIWMNRIELKTILWLGLAGIGVGVAAFPFLEQYQRDRVLTFLFPDPNASYGATYNVQQALVAIGSGGFFGLGYGHGTQTQLRFLKVRQTDFIFSVTSEEFGMMGGILVIVILAFVIWRCIRAAQKSRDVSGSMIAFGVGILLFFQGAANIAVNMNLIPVSGLPLPFISYGGSGLMALMVGIGLVESVAMRHKQMDF
jgi:rod shape determining protein RodA